MLEPFLRPLAEELSTLHIVDFPLQSLLLVFVSFVLVLTRFSFPFLKDAVSDIGIGGAVAPGSRHDRRTDGEREEAGYHDYSGCFCTKAPAFLLSEQRVCLIISTRLDDASDLFIFV